MPKTTKKAKRDTAIRARGRKKLLTWKKYLAESGAKGTQLGDRFVVFPPITGARLEKITDIDVSPSRRKRYVVEFEDTHIGAGGEKWFSTKAAAKAFFKEKKKSYVSKFLGSR